MAKKISSAMIGKTMRDAIHSIYSQQLGKAINLLENHLYTNPHPLPQDREKLERLKTDYQLMADYWQKGFKDPQRPQLYDQLLRRAYVLAVNISIRDYKRNSSYVIGISNRARYSRIDWSSESLRRDMESFVSDLAMLELEPEHTRQDKQRMLYEEHHCMMSSLFDYIWTGRLWTDNETKAYQYMLLSPTIDIIDQRLMVSAITVSLFNFFDINKFSLLLTVYQQAEDEEVRQRALIGWVLGLDNDSVKLYTEIHGMIDEVTSHELYRNELAELQMQMVFCLRTESDTQIIQNEIMPDLLNNNDLHVTRNGIEEMEEDPMEDILNPEISEQRMEKLEEGIQKMTNMRKQGSDIYFGGFSQMKRFPFFNTVSNWFVPYYPQNPVVSNVINHTHGSAFLKKMLDYGPFCDSDKYSFVLAFGMVTSKLPKHILEMIDQGEANFVGPEISPDEFHSPAFKRRIYLQNIYRFYHVYQAREQFYNPFKPEEQLRYFFFANPVFLHTKLEDKFGEVISFFLKHQVYDAAKLMLQNYREELRDAPFYLLNGHVMSKTHSTENAGLTVCQSYAKAVELDPENERAWVGYARALFGEHDYSLSLSYYQRLMDLHPDSLNYQLNAAVCLTNMGKQDEALKILYKLNYEMPDNDNVNRVFAWTLVGAHKYEQAANIYQGLLQKTKPEADDLLNAAYCQWFSGNVDKAVQLFLQYADPADVKFDAQTVFLQTDVDMILSHGVTEVEIQLMIDQLS